MAKRNRQVRWFKDGAKFVGITHDAIDRLNKHYKRTTFPPQPIGKGKAEISINARWLCITMAKNWNRKRPEDPFEYPIRQLAREIGWSSSKVSKCIKELLEAGILVREKRGGLYRERSVYNFDPAFMGVPGTKDRSPMPNPVKRLL